MSLSLMLRASPAAALLLSDDLLRSGVQFSAPQRLPFLLWTLAQAAKYSLAILSCCCLLAERMHAPHHLL